MSPNIVVGSRCTGVGKEIEEEQVWKLACCHSLLDFAVPRRRAVAAAPHQEIDLLLLWPPLFLSSASFAPPSHNDFCRQLYSNRDSKTEDHVPDADVAADLVDLTRIGEAAVQAAQHDVERLPIELLPSWTIMAPTWMKMSRTVILREFQTIQEL